MMNKFGYPVEISIPDFEDGNWFKAIQTCEKILESKVRKAIPTNGAPAVATMILDLLDKVELL